MVVSAAMSDRTIEFFFDIGSPYSYLASTQVAPLSERTGAPVRWRPFLLGGVFKASGNTMPASVQPKARWMLGDLQRWARHYDVPFKMSSRFPLNTLMTQRALVASGRIGGESAVDPFACALYEAYWVQDRNVADPTVIAEIAGAVGLDPDAVLAGAAEQESKDRLRADTDEAVKRGAFGAPTFFVGDTMFWGNARLMLIEAMLSS